VLKFNFESYPEYSGGLLREQYNWWHHRNCFSSKII